jgi:hypothetical protein
MNYKLFFYCHECPLKDAVPNYVCKSGLMGMELAKSTSQVTKVPKY